MSNFCQLPQYFKGSLRRILQNLGVKKRYNNWFLKSSLFWKVSEIILHVADMFPILPGFSVCICFLYKSTRQNSLKFFMDNWATETIFSNDS